MAEPGTVMTFYSYKGGTGRTMALANVAVLLARRSEGDVLAVDWDLEAPGLHRFFEPLLTTALRSRDGEIDRPDGLIELFREARERLESGDPPDDEEAAIDFWERLEPERHILESDIQSLYLLKAGRFDDDYPARVNTFNWEALYAHAPALFRGLVATFTRRYRYVLVDSRTGITDSSGICTMLLPERLVVVFTPNRQSLTGVVELVERASDYRKRSEDVRPLVVYPLASRVELSEPDLKRRWRNGDDEAEIVGYEETFEELFKEVYDLDECDLEPYFDDVQIQHATRFAYGEDIAVLKESESDRLSVAQSYVKFTRALLDPNGPWGYKLETASIEDDGRDDSALAQLEPLVWWYQHQADLVASRRRLLRALSVPVVLLCVAFGVVYYLVSRDLEETLAVAGLATLILVAALELVRNRFAPEPLRVAYEKALRILERERATYLAGSGVYADPATRARRLTEHVSHELDPVEDEIIKLGGKARRTRQT